LEGASWRAIEDAEPDDRQVVSPAEVNAKI